MVVPLPAPSDVGTGSSVHLQRFKIPLYALSAGYAVCLTMSVVAGNIGNALSWLFVLAMSFIIASNEDQCMAHCVMMYAMFTIMNLFLDILTLLEVLAQEYPSASEFFSMSCGTNVSFSLPNQTLVYTQSMTEYLVPKDTLVHYPEDGCSWRSVMANSAMLLVIVLDIGASMMGWRMFSTMTSTVEDGGLPGGGERGAARSPFLGFPGERAPGQQEMAGAGSRPGQNRGRQQRGTDANGFQAFSGEARQLSF